jgi:hypothetical protein
MGGSSALEQAVYHSCVEGKSNSGMGSVTFVYETARHCFELALNGTAYFSIRSVEYKKLLLKDTS